MAVVTVTTDLTAIATALDRAGGLTKVDFQVESGTAYLGILPDLTADAAATGGIIATAGQVGTQILERGQTLYGRTASGSAVVRYSRGAAA